MAKDGWEEHPCLWARGLVPGELLSLPEPQEADHRVEEGLVGGIFAPREQDGGWVHLGGDASGGPQAQDSRYRRVGVAVVQVGASAADKEELAHVRFVLKGEAQE
eukprot:1235180-Lingulodinium_polyedra.AAC.2